LLRNTVGELLLSKDAAHLMHATARLLCHPRENLMEIAAFVSSRAAANKTAKGLSKSDACRSGLPNRLELFVAGVCSC
jgi:hypothetical protein